MAGGVAWNAEEGSIAIGGTAYQSVVKDVSISGGGRDMEQVRAFGVNNEYPSEKPAEPFEVSFTLVGKDSDPYQFLLGGRAVAAGMGSTVELYPRTRRLVQLDFYDVSNVSGAQLRVELASSYAVSTEAKIGTEDSMEVTVGFKCLSKDFRNKYVADRITNAAQLT